MSSELVPEGHRWCMACDGGNSPFSTEPCGVCKGKGYWNADDIDDYHKRFPDLCTQSCGEKHIRFTESQVDLRYFERLFKETADLLREFGDEEGAEIANSISEDQKKIIDNISDETE